MTGKLKPPLQKKILEISVKPSPWFIMVIELSGVQFGLNAARVRFEITLHKVWFQKKIARQLPLVKSPLYYRHFEIAEFSQYQYERSSTRAGGAPYLSKSTLPRTFGNHVTVHRLLAIDPVTETLPQQLMELDEERYLYYTLYYYSQWSDY